MNTVVEMNQDIIIGTRSIIAGELAPDLMEGVALGRLEVGAGQ